jgi:hypothetical protein
MVSKCGGSVHDSRIWRNSVMLPVLTTYREQTALLGNSRYGLAPWLITLYEVPQTPTERYFNQKHASSRVIIERCFGQLKRRFPVLMNPIRVSIIDRVLKNSGICFVLHNIPKFPNISPEEDDKFKNKSSICWNIW